MASRTKGRELALQALYQLDITEENVDGALRSFGESFDVSSGARDFAWTLVHGVLERRSEIDALIADVVENWRFERLSQIDLNAIRIAVLEMTNEPPLPPEIAIDEAIELSRKFGTAESSRFVNGVLDQIAKRIHDQPTDG
jgi:N utilization substance protein B